MSNAIPAHPHELRQPVPNRLPAEVVAELSVLRPWRALQAIIIEWSCIIATIFVCERFWHSFTYVFAVMIIGSRQHALNVIAHDAVHYRLLPNKKWNDIVANLTLQWPTFITLEGFRHYHGLHHRFLGDRHDGNRVLWNTHTDDGRLTPEWTYPKTKAVLFFKLLRRASLITGLRWIIRGLSTAVTFGGAPRHAVLRFGFYGTMASILIVTQTIDLFFIYWIVPLCTWYIATQYIRLICEHSGLQSSGPFFGQTRTTLARWWERWLIVPRNIHYHIEHHGYPSVPFYNLPELHERLMARQSFREHAIVTRSVLESLAQCVVSAKATKT